MAPSLNGMVHRTPGRTVDPSECGNVHPLMTFRTAHKLILAALLVIGALVGLSGCFAGPVYKGEAMDNFDGDVFVNRDPMNKSPWDMIRLGWGSLTQAENWPGWIENTSDPDAIPADNTTGIQVTYINHSTTLVQMDGLNILTDPIYSNRASPVSWAGPKRVRAPSPDISALPHIDVVIISHNHYDHLDVETLQQLAAQQEDPPLVLAGLGNGQLFELIGLDNYQDLQWGEAHIHESVEFVFVECRHRSGRGISDQMKTLWGSFVIRSESGSVYFAGDTGYGPHFKEQGEQYGPFDLSIIPIGAYEPRWFMTDVHLNPEEAVKAHLDLKSRQSLSIHFGVFQLTYEAINAPEQELNIALANYGVLPDAFWTLEPGQLRGIQTTITEQ